MKIGKRVQKVAAYIRKRVKRPKRRPTDGHGSLRWAGSNCPMGLLPEAISPEPTHLEDFKKRPDNFTQADISAFANWWDCLLPEEAEGAIEAIWGQKATKTTKRSKKCRSTK